MVDVFDEVEEQLAQDRYQEAFKKYGPWALGVALFIILGASGWAGFNAWNDARHERASDAFFAALDYRDAGNTEQASAAFDTLREAGPSGYTTLALMQQAALALEAGNNGEAADLFDQAAASTSDAVIRDLATLKAVWARWDELSFADVEIRLSAMASGDTPYQAYALETIGVAAYRDGDYDRARLEFSEIASPVAPDGTVGRRASNALALLNSLDASAASETSDETETPAAGEAGND